MLTCSLLQSLQSGTLPSQTASSVRSHLLSDLSYLQVHKDTPGLATEPYKTEQTLHKLTIRMKGAFCIKSPTSFWYLRISLRATVPGRNRRTLVGAATDNEDSRQHPPTMCSTALVLLTFRSTGRQSFAGPLSPR